MRYACTGNIDLGEADPGTTECLGHLAAVEWQSETDENVLTKPMPSFQWATQYNHLNYIHIKVEKA